MFLRVFFVFLFCVLTTTGAYRLHTVYTEIDATATIQLNTSNVYVNRIQLLRMKVGEKTNVIYDSHYQDTAAYGKKYSLRVHAYSVELKIARVDVEDLKSVFSFYVTDRVKWITEVVQLSSSSALSACEPNLATAVVPGHVGDFVSLACGFKSYTLNSNNVFWMLPEKGTVIYGYGIVAPEFRAKYSSRVNETHSILTIRNFTAENFYLCGVSFKQDSLDVTYLGFYSVCADKSDVKQYVNNNTVDSQHHKKNTVKPVFVNSTSDNNATVKLVCDMSEHTDMDIIWNLKESSFVIYGHGIMAPSVEALYSVDFNDTHSILTIKSLPLKQQIYECRTIPNFDQLAVFVVSSVINKSNASFNETWFSNITQKTIGSTVEAPRATTKESLRSTNNAHSTEQDEDYADISDKHFIVLHPKYDILMTKALKQSSGMRTKSSFSMMFAMTVFVLKSRFSFLQ